MTKACIVVNKYYRNNRLFDINNPVLNKDNGLYGFYLLKKKFGEFGVDLSTQDINPAKHSEIVIFNDMPTLIPSKMPGQRLYLLAMESIAVEPNNFDIRKYAVFNKVFTWKDDIIDNNKIIKVNYSFLFPQLDGKDNRKKDKYICLVANNRKSHHETELYTERKRVIEWFEQNHPQDFDLYGIGWDSIIPVNTLVSRLIWKIGLGRFLVRKKYECFKGAAIPKIPILKKYRFNICYENVADIPGYITEKIFDCFFAGCVPIYLGANNITQYIPETCFIDKRKYPTYEGLYNYLETIKDEEYDRYVNEGRTFLITDKSKEFSADYFAKVITNAIFQ